MPAVHQRPMAGEKTSFASFEIGATGRLPELLCLSGTSLSFVILPFFCLPLINSIVVFRLQRTAWLSIPCWPLVKANVFDILVDGVI